MPSMPSGRRAFLLAAGAALFPGSAAAARPASEALARLEARSTGRLGLAAHVLGAGPGAVSLTYRADERFALCSTFKLLLVAAVLWHVERGREDLRREIRFGPADLLAHAPVTRAQVARGALPVATLCRAALAVSDNTAANLLLRAGGGHAAFTRWLRDAPLADPQTRLDRTEPSLNTALPGDPRDTSTPRRIAADLERVFTPGRCLRPASLATLEDWMRGSVTGLAALRAGFPAEWLVLDKTGSGERGTRNDIAFVRRSGRAPLVVAVFLTGAERLDDAGRNAVLAAAGRIVAARFA